MNPPFTRGNTIEEWLPEDIPERPRRLKRWTMSLSSFAKSLLYRPYRDQSSGIERDTELALPQVTPNFIRRRGTRVSTVPAWTKGELLLTPGAQAGCG